MNTLSFTTSVNPIWGLAFYLRLDGETLSKVLGLPEEHSSIPFWLVETDLAGPDEAPTTSSDCERVIAVCSCGEFGCGGATARVTKFRRLVTFSDFKPVSSPKGFAFSRSNYDEVVGQMKAIALDYRETGRI